MHVELQLFIFSSDDKAWADWRRQDNEEAYHREKLQYVEYGDCAVITPSDMTSACPSKYNWQLATTHDTVFCTTMEWKQTYGMHALKLYSTFADLALKIHFISVF